MCVAAPAGHGKSILIAAWMHWLSLQGPQWGAAAATGIAASQVGGITLHALLLASTGLESALHSDPERLARIRAAEGFPLGVYDAELEFHGAADGPVSAASAR